MTIQQDHQLKPHLEREFTATGIIGPTSLPTNMTGNLRVAIENVGGGNDVDVEGRLNGQTAWIVLDTISGATSGTTVDISVVDEIRFNCTAYAASGGTPKIVASGFFKKATGGGGGGVVNSASNVGVGGVGVFDSLVADDLQFNNINAGSSKVTVTLDGANKEVDIDVDPAEIDKNTLGGSELSIANGGTGAGTAANARTSLGITPANIGAATTSHKSTHVVSGSDAFAPGDLLDATAKVGVSKNSGAVVGTRRKINFIEGSGCTLTISDDAGNEEVDITIATPATPSTATYVTMSLDGTLSNERVLAVGDRLSLTDGGAGGNVTLDRKMWCAASRTADEFTQQTLVGITSTVSGTGATGAFINTTDPDHPGLYEIRTGTTATGRVSLNSTATAIRFGLGKHVFEHVFSLQALSDVSQTYIVRSGFIDSGTNTESTDGVFFRYTDTGASPNWICVTRNNNVETTANSGVAAVSSWQNLRVEVDSTATNATFFINGVQVANITTNIPTAAGRETGYGFQIVKTVGTTQRTMANDMYSYEFIYER